MIPKHIQNGLKVQGSNFSVSLHQVCFSVYFRRAITVALALVYLRMAQIAGRLSVSGAIVFPYVTWTGLHAHHVAAPIVSGMMATYRDSVSTSGEFLSYHDVKSNILRRARTPTQKLHVSSTRFIQ